MRKYLLRYLIFWLPAVLVTYLYNNASTLSQILQWFFAFFMVLGWGVNTGMATYYYPRTTLALLLGYTGFNSLIINIMYTSAYYSQAGRVLHRFGGIFSFQPLDIFIQALLDFNIPHELYILLFLVGVCLIGYLAGIAYRWVHPNPYRPRIHRTG